MKKKLSNHYLRTCTAVLAVSAVCLCTACSKSDTNSGDSAQTETTTAAKKDSQTNDKAEKADVTVGTETLTKTTYTRQAEYLDRGLIAAKTENGVFLSWRYLGTDTADTAFKIYRDGTCITDSPITDSTNYLDASGTDTSVYHIEVLSGDTVTDTTSDVTVWADNYLDIPLNRPEGGTTPDGVAYTYGANDASVGDLDGDGQYEIVLKWEPTNAQDNSNDGYTGNVYLDAYELDGTQLWRIDLGVNIRAGAHYTQFIVYDLDGDGMAELVCKTADGTTDGAGTVIGDATADYRNSAGRILEGPEYLTLFDGQTGAALDTIEYEQKRGNVASWGDDYGNRVDRFLAAVAYLDGQKPSVIMCRGYYTRSVLVAYDIVDKKLVKRWKFDSGEPGNASYAGQGNHNLAVADVDWDGKDEIVYGMCTIDDDGTGLYNSTLGHGDALHVGDFLPERDGLEIWSCLESFHGASLRDGTNGRTLLRINADSDTGRAICGNFIPGNNGAEFVSSADNNVYDANGNVLTQWSSITKWSPNYAIYWDSDLEQEVMDRTMIDKYEAGRIFTAKDVVYINGTKANANLCADILGDWREEVIWPTVTGTSIRLYTTTDVTEHRIFTLMHDMQYRCQVASQNVAYNQGACTSFFLGTGYELPTLPDIETIKK